MGVWLPAHRPQSPAPFPGRGGWSRTPGRSCGLYSAPLLPPLPYPITAAGLANQGETFLLWDAASGEPVTPAIVWQDKRGQSVCDRLSATVDASWLRRKTGLVLDTYFCAPKLSYVLESSPLLRSAARCRKPAFRDDRHLADLAVQQRPAPRHRCINRITHVIV